MEIPEEMRRMAADLDQTKIPNMFLGEIPHFNWQFETCIMDNGMPGIRIVFAPALMPYIKLSLPFHPKGLEAFRDDISTALERFASIEKNTQNGTEKETPS